MDDLRKKKIQDKNKKILKKIKFISFLKKNKIKIILFLLFVIILLFPVESGKFIGKFITDFLGTMIKNINL